ncbi:MAG: DNA-binding protein [Actinobacteria bacterium]|nr:MAG: DNA-binding protein [Actinomycetota bacterium]
MEKLLDVKEVAKYLGYTQRTIYNMIDRNDIPFVKIGKEYRFKESDIENLVQAKKVKKCGLDKVKEIEDPFKKRLYFMGVLTKELKKQGVEPVIVGGQAVEFYTAGGYATYDIDIAAPSEPVGAVLSKWHFQKEGRHWVSVELDISIEAPAFGLESKQLERLTELLIDDLKVFIIGVEDIVLDRLNAYVHWNSKDDLSWAKEIIVNNKKSFDWDYLKKEADDKVIKKIRNLEKEICTCEKD